MRKLKLAVAAVALASACAGAGAASAQAYGYGGYGPTPAYAARGESYAPYDTYNRGRPGFTLVGARAGVTVLGVNLDGGAGVRLSAGDGGGYRHHHEGAPSYAPPPPPPPEYPPEPQYAPAPYEGGYVTSYSYPTYPAPCGCGW